MGVKSIDNYNLFKGINILSKQEFEELYNLPKLNLEEKQYYFYINQNVLKSINNYTITAKVLFILELGYFKASKQFYSFSISQTLEDVKFILGKYFPSYSHGDLKGGVVRNTRWLIRKKILDITTYKPINKFIESKINLKIKEILSIDTNPKYIFYELLRFFDREKIVIPPYSKMQTLISNNLNEFENDLYARLEQQLDSKIKKKLDTLLKKEEKDNKFLLTIIRLPAKGFSYSEVEEEISKKKEIEKLFQESKRILKEIGLNIQSIKYAAKLVDRYRVFQIQKFSPTKRYLYLLCFVYYRYLKVNDDLTNTFLYLTGKYYGLVRKLSQEQLIIDFYKNRGNIHKFTKIIEYITDKTDFDSLIFREVKERFYKILPPEEIKKLNRYIAKNAAKETSLKWAFYDEKYQLIIKNIRPLIKEIEFGFSNSLKLPSYNLATAVLMIQKSLREKKDIDWKKVPTNFISHIEKEHLIMKGKLNTRRFEIYIYNKLREKINSGDVHITDSWEFKSLEDYLISLTYFRKHEKEIIKQLNLPFLEKSLSKILKDKLKILDLLFHEVNKRILDGNNKHFQQKRNNNWTLKYDSFSDEENDNIFSQINLIELVNLLKFVQDKTSFLSEFTHIARKRIKLEIDENMILATLISYGTNIGAYKMGSSCNFSYEQLTNTGNTRFREETLLQANEQIVNNTLKLPIFKYFNIGVGSIHSGSDGQKFSVGVKTIMARYSQKYFGLDKGISVLTLNANFQPLASKVISANEYEGHHVLELLLMNESEIQSEKHSTDTHGVNEINFALLDFFGYTFCPRYRQLNKKAEKLISPKPIRDYPKAFPIRPIRVIKPNIILKEEENIKRVIASLALKKSTVGTIVKKISNLPENNSLRRAFAEFNRILASIYVLKYINSMTLRRDVQKSLNRSEAYHKLKRAVAYANSGKIIAKSESEQNVYQNSTMVICSAIIYYNSLILSLLLNKKKCDIAQVKKTTPISWSNINLYGKYVFSNSKRALNLDKQIPKFLKKSDDL